MVTVRVGVARRVQPPHRQPFAVVRRLQQRVDSLLVRVRRPVGQERVDLGRRRRQSGQVVGDASQQRFLVRFGRRLKPLALETGEDELIDRIARPSRPLRRRRLRACGRHVGPVRVPLGTRVNPSAQHGNLRVRQRVARLEWRHPLLRIGMGDHLDEQALGGIARLDHAALGKRALTGVEVKPRLPLLLVRAVAGEAVVGEDREDLPGETDRRDCSSAPASLRR